jgi:hypothetical protein
LQRAGFSLPSIASALKASCPTNEAFVELVREQLYRDFPFNRKDVDSDEYRDAFVKYICDGNLTLKAIASLCTAGHRENGPFSRNRLVHAIVNFNVDTIFREYIQARYRSLFVRTIERSTARPKSGRIGIYHMHGHLRFDPKQGIRSKEGTDKLVFTEQEYFDFFNRPTSLFNYTFLSLLREHSCLFVGLSMQDDNIRRLLHISTTEQVQDYRERDECEPDEKEIVRHFVILRRSGKTELDLMKQRSLLQLGTRVLWIDKRSDIVERLGTVYESGGGNWNVVY